jgi:hypothetical protein
MGFVSTALNKYIDVDKQRSNCITQTEGRAGKGVVYTENQFRCRRFGLHPVLPDGSICTSSTLERT